MSGVIRGKISAADHALGSRLLAGLLDHSWPGNVRELRNAMEELALLAPGPSLIAADLQQYSVNAVSEDNPDGNHPKLVNE